MSLRLDKYELLEERKLEDLNSTGLLLKHIKSGARVVVLSNDDENKVFSIGFKTPPYNDTGLQHIIEHSVLCGSRKYPVKDPFVELCKGSLNTFLNAMTYPDKTVYPVASCNEVDFKNIMDVYMDAVFYPNIYTKPEIFKQEGWHYELEDADSLLEYNGVVYNEMKGAYSSPDEVLSNYTFISLFPDTCYSKESGGDPKKIPQLTYEEFLNYHKNYYHPENSYIYLYGNIDIQERLDYLDEEYLKEFDRIGMDTQIGLQKPFNKMVTKVSEYAITEDESLDNNSYLSYNVVVGTSLNPKLYLAMQILDYALVMAPGAKLKQALIDKGIGTDIYSSYESSVYQPVYSIIAKNANEAQQQEFIETIKEVLSDIATNGIEERAILAGINYYEFKYREADFGAYPKGLMYGLQMMDSWLYDESKPFIHIEAGKTFDMIKEESKHGLFENIIKEQLLGNNHASLIVLLPKKNLTEKMETAVEEELQKYKALLTEEKISTIIKDTKDLEIYQDEASSQEALETIPMLAIDDIKKEAAPLYIDKKRIADIDVIHHNMFTNKIAYTLLSFDCKNVPEVLIPYVGLLSSVLGFIDTKNFSYAELANEININSGGISTSASIYTDSNDLSKYAIKYEVRTRTMYEKVDFAFNIIKEILFDSKFTEYKRLKEIVSTVKSRLESSMTNSGHSVAMLEAMAQFSETGYYSNLMRGYKFYKLMEMLESDFDNLKEDISHKLSSLVKLIFRADNMLVSYTANEEGYEKLTQPMTQFVSQLEKDILEVAIRQYKQVNVKTAYTSSSQVQYVARCGNYVSEGFHYSGALKVLKVIFSYDYLWINVRVKGGAYGCMSGFNHNGDSYFASYRDPNLAKTNKIYEEAPNYIRKFTVSDRDMVKYIIGTIGEMDTPMNPSAKGMRSFGAYVSNVSYEDMQKERDEVINAKQEDIRKLADLIESVIKQNYFCVVGNAKQINDEKKMFDMIQNLF
ncbi:insulinase family protein [[Clostridium] fimetarium]|uniref:Peptidase M16C associated domain-containing protein n=1 Tax=[Clostridium] fimetarium TaxID=99656 RepID=A0A1I0RK44_9FIRM|nr:insulinase family protein [[Clostridium] fimetarium]SEW41387.1 hypothetical protein SAMN05421659_11741 [[Clostridium] fimetarium]